MYRLSYLLLILAGGPVLAGEPPRAEKVAPLIEAHCIKCHGPDKQAGGVRLDDLAADLVRDRTRWLAVRDQLRDGLMPPPKEPRLEDAKVRAAVAWLTEQLGAEPARLPNQGNLIPHELLFGKPAPPGTPPPGRVWRLSPAAYMGFVRDLTRGMPQGLVQPFATMPERGIKDFAGLYTIDEPSTEILLRNAEAIVKVQTAHEIKDGKVQGKNDSIREFVALMDPAVMPTRERVGQAIQLQFRLALGRPAREKELERLLDLYEKCAALGDRAGAIETTLQAVLLKTDALFRSELGRPDGSGRRMLAPDELVRAVSLALGERRDPALAAAAASDRLETREQVATHVRRILDDPKAAKPRLMGFFREYFEYHKAADVFKDKPQGFAYEPRILVTDTDALVQHILDEDRDVFRELLTTPKSFVNLRLKESKEKRGTFVQAPAQELRWRQEKGEKKPFGIVAMYGFDEFPTGQPVEVPGNRRLGILMQPSWLAAWSTNFDNDPVRRGRWVRERLLGGTVPELPIGVAAQVPDDPHRTFRDRLTVTRDVKCWKCHQRMDELGLPFEQFDHYGRYRTTETVLDPEATAKNVDNKGKSLGRVTREVPLATSGRVDASGDTRLDGPVKDPYDLVRKFAASDRARQVFVRHAFRYFLGRNETLSDARTLQEADRAYSESGGSFRSLVVSLLTSDSFLYRAPTPPEPSTGARP
jgi:hypothetical protein